jgi:hypothetical protein
MMMMMMMLGACKVFLCEKKLVDIHLLALELEVDIRAGSGRA